MHRSSPLRLAFWVMAGVAFIAACAGWVEAKAGEVRLDWTTPTGTETCQYMGERDTPLTGIRVYEMVEELPGDAEFWTAEREPGDYRYVVTSVTETGESRTSYSVTKTIEALTATAGATVYQVTTITNGFFFIPAGTLSEDVQCDASQKVNDFYKVPVDKVTWPAGSDVRPLMVVADCS